jgi:chromate transporter
MMMIVSIGEWAGGLLGTLVVVIAFLARRHCSRLWSLACGNVWRNGGGELPFSRDSLHLHRIAAGGLLYDGERSNYRTGNRHDRRGWLLILLQYKINPALLVLGGAIVGILSFTPK